MPAPDFHAQVLTEEFAAMVDPLKAFRMACDSGAVEQTASICRRDLHIEKVQADIAAMGTLDIFEVQRVLEALFAGADGDTCMHLQQVLETVKEDAVIVARILDEEADEECHAHSQFGMGA